MYGEFVYGNASVASLNKLRVALNSCIRYVFNLSRYSSVSQFHKTLIGCNFGNFHDFRICVQLFKIIKTKEPPYLYSNLQFLRNTRTRSLLIHQHSTTYYGNSMLMRGISLWNRLTPNLKMSISLKSFKEGLLEELERMQ